MKLTELVNSEPQILEALAELRQYLGPDKVPDLERVWRRLGRDNIHRYFGENQPQVFDYLRSSASSRRQLLRGADPDERLLFLARVHYDCRQALLFVQRMHWVLRVRPDLSELIARSADTVRALPQLVPLNPWPFEDHPDPFGGD